MKIAIKGHESRGREVIQILENLGGCNIGNCLGTGSNEYYYLDPCLNISATSVRYNFKESEIYTLEEFEKKFPYKIGDKVIHCYASNFVGTVVDIKFDDNIPYRVNINGIICTCGTMTLKPYKEMNTRNITLALDKAKVWYKKGGELKEIALQAFTEKELTKVDLPKTWEEFCIDYPQKKGECYIDNCSNVAESCGSDYSRDIEMDRNVCPSMKSAEAHLAMIQLEQLRDCWWNGWEPIWDISEKWCIRLWGNELSIGIATNISRFLTFPTKEMAEEFLKCFRDLIEKAGDLI